MRIADTPKPTIATRLFLLLLCSAAPTVVADTCPNAVVTADQLYWDYLDNKVWSLWDYRDYLMEYYDLAESDWDGGWGVHKLDDPNPHQYALPKMMNAMDYLLFGLSDTPKYQSSWGTRIMGSSGEGTRLSALSRSGDSIELFGRRVDNAMAYTVLWPSSGTWLPGEISPAQMTYIIHLRGDKGLVPMHGAPTALSRVPNSLDVFYRSDNQLIHAQWKSAATDTVEFATVTTDWQVDSPTDRMTRSVPIMGQDRYFISTDPVVITRGLETLDVFAIEDTTDNLIHYFWTPVADWNAEDVSQVAGGTRPFRDDPVVINRGGINLDVLIADDRGHLIHFAWSANDGWVREDVTELVGTEYAIDSKPVVISRAADSLDVFARGQIGDLMHFYWTSASGWQVGNLTEDLEAEPIDGRPAVLARSESLHLFARGYTWRALIHFYWSEATGWGTEDLTVRQGFTTSYRVDGDPVATGADDRVDVYARNMGGHLIHYYWTPDTSWLAENANYSPNVSATFDLVEHDPLVVVPRMENVSDVIGKRNHGSIHFTSAIGLSLNTNPWHTNAEYSRLAAGSQHQFEYEPEDDDSAGAAASWGPFQDDYVAMYCPSFDATAYPALRASWMVHEATHMNYHLSHDEVNGRDVDQWIFHGLRSPTGRLTGGVPAEGSNYVLVPTHTPYQLSVESLCDFSEMSKDDIPAAAYQNADDDADFYMNSSISNPPGWTCGVPRPLY